VEVGPCPWAKGGVEKKRQTKNKKSPSGGQGEEKISLGKGADKGKRLVKKKVPLNKAPKRGVGKTKRKGNVRGKGLTSKA